MELARAQQSQTEVAFYTSPLCTPVATTPQSKQNITWVLESAQACQILLASVYLVGLEHVIRNQGGLATELDSTAYKQCFASQANTRMANFPLVLDWAVSALYYYLVVKNSGSFNYSMM